MTSRDFDLYFALRLAFCGRPEARIRMFDDRDTARRHAVIEDIIDANPFPGQSVMAPWVRRSDGPVVYPRYLRVQITLDWREYVGLTRQRAAGLAARARGMHERESGVRWGGVWARA